MPILEWFVRDPVEVSTLERFLSRLLGRSVLAAPEHITMLQQRLHLRQSTPMLPGRGANPEWFVRDSADESSLESFFNRFPG